MHKKKKKSIIFLVADLQALLWKLGLSGPIAFGFLNIDGDAEVQIYNTLGSLQYEVEV